jgi:hypothetical protein
MTDVLWTPGKFSNAERPQLPAGQVTQRD